ncbi:MAG: hypothetical protein RBT75_20435 [Anaerolineae bacterium]|nr:hypothetical protein [Anaerolineae bacterium]
MRQVTRCLFTLLVLVLLGCKQTELQPTLPAVDEVPASEADTSLVTHQPCAPPCWQGIRPGMPKAEAVRLLQNIPFVDPESLDEQSNELCWDRGCLIFDNAQVESLWYWLSYSLELQQMIEIYGEPDGYRYIPYVGEEEKGDIGLYWPQEGISAVIPSIELRGIHSKSPTSPEVMIISVRYFEPVADAESLFAGDEYPAKPDDMSVLEWIGYEKWEGYVPMSRP